MIERMCQSKSTIARNQSNGLAGRLVSFVSQFDKSMAFVKKIGPRILVLIFYQLVCMHGILLIQNQAFLQDYVNPCS